MITYRTQFSTYEVDEEHQHIRRLDGENEPTPRQGADGEWKPYHRITPVVVAGDSGPSLYIEWSEGKGTLTSRLAT